MTQENGSMSPFKKAMQSNPSRLVVLYRRGVDGTEEFQWGIVGTIPALTLIGGIIDAQIHLMASDLTQGQECDESAFVIMFTDDGMFHFCHRDIPAIPLVGMLETIKVSLTLSRLQSAPVQTQILGPDGSPMKDNRVYGG